MKDYAYNSTLRRPQKPMNRGGRSAHTCAFCGGQFLRLVSQVMHRGAKYCSRECYEQGRVAEGSAKPVRDKYGRSRRVRDVEWQKAVREKDDYTCQRCGKYEQYIHTHHVAPRSQRPDLRYDVSNGKCLCNSCHQWVHMHPAEARELGLLSVPETYEVARDSGRHHNNVLLTHKGETLWMAEWARRLHCDRHVLEARRKRGWSDQKIIETPIRECEETSLSYKGRTMNLTAWSRETGLHLSTIRARVKAGWNPQRILETPPIEPKLRRTM